MSPDKNGSMYIYLYSQAAKMKSLFVFLCFSLSLLCGETPYIVPPKSQKPSVYNFFSLSLSPSPLLRLHQVMCCGELWRGRGAVLRIILHVLE